MTTKIPQELKNKKKCHKIALLWHFSGRFYVGGWSDDSKDGRKTGIGLEYYPNSTNIVTKITSTMAVTSTTSVMAMAS